MGSNSKRGNQVTKFQEGVNGNIKDSFLNIETDLSMDGVDQSLEAKLITLSGDFSISFFDERSAVNINKMIFAVGDDNADFLTIRTGQSGTVHPYEVFLVSGGVTIDARNNIAKDSDSDNTDWINRKTHAFFNFDQTNTKIDCYINGELQWTETDANFTGLLIDGLLRIGTTHFAGFTYQGNESHVCVFDRLATQDEIEYIGGEGGDIPKNLRANCISHHAITERFGHKADAAFAAKHTQFSVGDNVGAFDTVEQYNEAKITPLVANHAKAINYTDAEIGTGGDVRTQSIKKGFYNKITNIWYNGGGDPDPHNMTEVSSGFIPILDGLLHDSGISISASYTSITGMGFTFQLLTDITLLNEIITGLPTITKFVFNGVEIASEALLVAAINDNNLCHIDLEWASASPTITFVHTGENYQLMRDYYLDETLDILDIKKLTNNILFANPPIYMQSKFNYYALHNEQNYIAGATNPENVPLIDVDAIGNRESLGWTGGDAATKLADLVTNISLISDLR